MHAGVLLAPSARHPGELARPDRRRPHTRLRAPKHTPSLPPFYNSISPRGKTQARIYDTLFKSEDPSAHEDWLSDINPRSLEVLQGCLASPNLAAAKPGDTFQFERLGWVTRS